MRAGRPAWIAPLVLVAGFVAGAPGVARGAEPRRHPVLEAIEARYASGAIDEGTRHTYRVAAIKDPSQLPADLRNLLPLVASPQPGAFRPSHSRLFGQAYRWQARHGQTGSTLDRLLLPPDDLANVIESAILPIRVSYGPADLATLAQLTLVAAETSWAVQVDGYGFRAPPIEDGAVMYRFYLQDASGTAGYTAPYGPNPDTSHNDCLSYIVIDHGNDEWSLESTVAHELSHAIQAGTDCVEVMPYWENTAIYIMSQVFPSSWFQSVYLMSYFQRQPWRALDYMNVQNSDWYEYGGVLFNVYLTDTYAPQDGPMMIREIWEAGMQPGEDNEPDYYDAIENVVAARGHDHSIQDILVDFSESRFFVGRWADGEHISGAHTFNAQEVAVARQHSSSSLPIRDLPPPEHARPASMGSNHILLTLSGNYQRPLTFSFDGDEETDWAVRVIRFGRSSVTVSEDLELDADGAGSLEVDPQGYTDILLLVVNLGQPGYDPDNRLWPLSGYVYSIEPRIEPRIEPAVITALVPDVVERGQQELAFSLQGSGFVSGADFDLSFDDPSIQLTEITSILDKEVLFTATLPRLTELGYKDLTVTNNGGAQSVCAACLEVVDVGALTVDPIDPSGCPCHAGRGATTPPLLPTLLVGLALLGMRRRRRGLRGARHLGVP